jgi:hypothetical protein
MTDDISGPSWTTTCPGLVQIFGALAFPDESQAQFPGWTAQWRDRQVKALPMRGQMAATSLYLRITSIIGVGEDDRRLTFVPSNATPASQYNNNIQETLYGLRRVTLNLEAQMSDVADGSDAISMLERIRSRMRRRHVIDAMLALDVAQVRIEAARALPKKAEQHIQSRAQMDVILTMLSSDTDPVPTGWIATLSISSKIQDTSGATLPVPPNFNDLIVNLP